MQFTLAHVGSRSAGGDEFAALTQLYVQRTSAFVPCEALAFKTETDLLKWLARKPGRAAPLIVLLDSRGKQMTSEAFASWIAARRDEGTRDIAFAIGPANGWSEESRKRAQLLLSLGSVTLAPALARL